MSKRIPIIEDKDVTIDGKPYDPVAMEARIDRLMEQRLQNLVPGRKSLSGDGTHSPSLQIRLPEELRDELNERAAQEGVSVSKVARRALEQYLRAS